MASRIYLTICLFFLFSVVSSKYVGNREYPEGILSGKQEGVVVNEAPVPNFDLSNFRQNSRRIPRQDNEDEEDSDDGTTKRSVPLIPALAGILKAAVGGENATLNFTRIQSAVSQSTKNFFRPVSTFTNFIGLTKPEGPVVARSPGEEVNKAQAPITITNAGENKKYSAQIVDNGEIVQNVAGVENPGRNNVQENGNRV